MMMMTVTSTFNQTGNIKMYKYKKFFTVMDKTLSDLSDEEVMECWQAAVESVNEFGEYNFEFLPKKQRRAAAWQCFVDALIECGDDDSDNPLHPVALSVVETIQPKDFPTYFYSLVIGADIADGIKLKAAVVAMEEWLDSGDNRRFETLDGIWWLNRDLSVTRKPVLIDVSKKREA